MTQSARHPVRSLVTGPGQGRMIEASPGRPDFPRNPLRSLDEFLLVALAAGVLYLDGRPCIAAVPAQVGYRVPMPVLRDGEPSRRAPEVTSGAVEDEPPTFAVLAEVDGIEQQDVRPGTTPANDKGRSLGLRAEVVVGVSHLLPPT